VLQINFQWVKVPSREVTTRSVASRKLVWGDPCSEGSEPAKSGTDEQERHKRHKGKDEYPHQYDVLGQQSNADAPKGNFLYVDAAGIG
jgi:hypothetical protein